MKYKTQQKAFKRLLIYNKQQIKTILQVFIDLQFQLNKKQDGLILEKLSKSYSRQGSIQKAISLYERALTIKSYTEEPESKILTNYLIQCNLYFQVFYYITLRCIQGIKVNYKNQFQLLNKLYKIISI
ncbi:hypothetical protein IMG5_023010 [Ichthyophthirius multifiliis]|uniref:Tetratricopeptide repeat protein n=1 Tax=Ichthyophthirius multifiliis TaxID=5932 RepID=G0QKW5_ICHMU|nr:hypothetical protein IMG5_023010 [Ichthyophthirius multifiliis]EGR34140.1 hypothetical protein IMG5_023010 [Ichthyophthirius multifiliis]|eukprot:XP_004039444.1 hypothetical protein IMG5_023010 [Ichthyophthirius multifiliis]